MPSLCATTLPLVIFGPFGIAELKFSSAIHWETSFVDSSACSGSRTDRAQDAVAGLDEVVARETREQARSAPPVRPRSSVDEERASPRRLQLGPTRWSHHAAICRPCIRSRGYSGLGATACSGIRIDVALRSVAASPASETARRTRHVWRTELGRVGPFACTSLTLGSAAASSESDGSHGCTLRTGANDTWPCGRP